MQTNTNSILPSNWPGANSSFFDKQVITMLFLGFSAGLPLLLIFSSLSLWLNEAGVERSAVTMFSWAALGYSFKFVWAPLVDHLPLPFLQVLGRRRSWIFCSQICIVLAIVGMSSVDPSQGESALTYMALFAVILGFSSATQDIVIDAYRIESAPLSLQAMMSSSYVAGYRLALIVAGAGALILAEFFGSSKAHYSYQSWQTTYLCMACIMALGIATTFLAQKEPIPPTSQMQSGYFSFLYMFVVVVVTFILVFVYFPMHTLTTHLPTLKQSPFLLFVLECLRILYAAYIAFFAAIVWTKLGFIQKEQIEKTWLAPISDFFVRYGLRTAVLLLVFISLYRISDIVLGIITNLFYQDIGYSKGEIAGAVKTVGVIMVIIGGYAGGFFAKRFGVFIALLWGAIASAATNLLFIALAYSGHSYLLMQAVVASDNLAAGFASAAFIAFLSSLTNISFTAMQYAIFSSLMTLIPKVLGGYSGAIMQHTGYPLFFTFTAILGLPIIFVLILAKGKLNALQTPQ